MRAALPHLRVLTLKMDSLFLLNKYLTAEEKIFLAKKMVFMEEICPELVPPSTLSSSTAPRAVFEEFSGQRLELEPEDLINTDPSKMVLEVVGFDERDTNTLYTKQVNGKQKFNSWFCPKFDEGVFFDKGPRFSIRVVLPRGETTDCHNFTLGQILKDDVEQTNNSITFGLENFVLDGEKWDKISIQKY